MHTTLPQAPPDFWTITVINSVKLKKKNFLMKKKNFLIRKRISNNKEKRIS